MCGICLILSLNLNEDDINTLSKIKKYNSSFDDEKEDSKFEEENTFINNQLNFTKENFYDIKNIISNRGPDYIRSIEITEQNSIKDFDIELDSSLNLFEYLIESKSKIMISSVLNLRGIDFSVTKQPIINEDTGNILQYNGEIFNIMTENSEYDLLKQNDGLILSKILNKISEQFYLNTSNEIMNTSKYAEIFLETLSKIESDHALVYYDRLNNKIMLNRDLFGKRSLLLVYFKIQGIFLITSVLPKSLNFNPSLDYLMEIPANSIVILDTNSKITEGKIFFMKNIFSPSSLRFPITSEISLPVPIKSLSIDLIEDCYKLLYKAVYKRISNLPEIASNNTNIESNSSIAVLFSGGIDSLLLAYFTIISIPEELNNKITVDLVNVSFDKENAPDRNSGLIAYYELKLIFPNRNINLILVDKTYAADVEFSGEFIKSLIFPKNTHMDFNISTALNLATKLQGWKVIDNLFFEYMEKYFQNIFSKLEHEKVSVKDYSNNILSKKLSKIEYSGFVDTAEYKSKSKIVLSGLGADEFFGGYSRYKSSYKSAGIYGLIQEMSKDIDRVWTRNFGRDDRACSDNGIELRFPFFDLELINFLAGVDDIKFITDFELNRGEGEKILLRNLCKRLNFKISHCFEKRAIQFGTKLARESNVKIYGSNRKANGKAQFK